MIAIGECSAVAAVGRLLVFLRRGLRRLDALDDRLPLAATVGGRYTYLGFLPDSNHADAILELELQGDDETVLRGAIATRTLAPGGDLLTLSTVAASPAITWARLEEGLVPGKARHLEVGVDRALSSNAHIRTKLFAEQQQDALVTVFRDGTPIVRNAGMLAAKGFGVTLGRRFGRAVDGSVTYTFGQTRRSGRVAPRSSVDRIGKPAFQQFQVAGDDGEKIVEVMGHSSGELAHGFHLLGLAQLLLDLAQRFRALVLDPYRLGDTVLQGRIEVSQLFPGFQRGLRCTRLRPGEAGQQESCKKAAGDEEWDQLPT